MSQQQEARAAFRALFDDLLRKELYSAIVKAQEQAAADMVAAELWPTLALEKLLRLVDRDRDFLTREGGLPAKSNQFLIDSLCKAAEDRLKTTLPANRFTQGAKLRSIVKETVHFSENQDRICRLADSIFAKEETDRLARPQQVHDEVLVRLNDYCLNECQQVVSTNSQVEDEVKRHLKILSVLTRRQDTTEKKRLLTELVDGKTKSLPYLIRYLRRGKIPFHLDDSFGVPEPDANVFPSELLTACTEANYIRDALVRFLKQQGLLSEYLKVDAPISEALQDWYEACPSMVPIEGIHVTKELALQHFRRREYSIADGVACAVAMGSLLEWTIRQAIYVLSLGAYEKPRAVVLYHRLHENKIIQKQTKAHLDVIFGEGTFARRDGLAHSAFFADSRPGVSSDLGLLCDALRRLTADLLANAPHVFATQRWDNDGIYAPSAEEQRAVQVQFSGGNNLIVQIQGERGRKHISNVLRDLVPDKRFVGLALILFWVSTQNANPDNFVAAKQFAAIINGLVTFEELFRAVQEHHRLPVLRLTPDGHDVMKCELAMLSSGIGDLLQDERLKSLFGIMADEPEFGISLRAVVMRRDGLYHGKLALLGYDMPEYVHLIAKFIFALCTTI